MDRGGRGGRGGGDGRGRGGGGDGRGRGGGRGDGANRQAPLGPNVVADMELIKSFFMQYRAPGSDSLYYPPILSAVANRERKTIPLSLEAMARFSGEHRVLASSITNNVLSALDDITTVAQSILPPIAFGPNDTRMDVVDALVAQYKDKVPPTLSRRFELDIEPMEDYEKPVVMRDLKAVNAGRLVVLRGVVVSASPVRSLLRVHTSLCEVCSVAVFVEVVGDKFALPSKCPSESCRTSRSRGLLRPQYKASRFVEYQELRLQELRTDVPLGALPRTMKIVCEGSLTCGVGVPGSSVVILGALVPDLSHKATRRMFGDCQVSLIVNAVKVQLEKVDYASSMNYVVAASLKSLKTDDDDPTRMRKAVNSVAPEIFGLTDIKKVVLCLLAGGQSVSMKDGMRIRGDINILFTGDPGVAKSQILKWVSNIVPRGVFTSGMGSSGVGLTAAVVTDPITGENVLEPGTLVFADKGVCCIDEFDKMNETDRTALHEVMEQQTISIAKAGIITTMNCRTAILAASNPQYGRWNSMKSPMDNINIPTALFSRFDVVWVIRDRYDEDDDKNLATHVALVHAAHHVGTGTTSGADTAAPESVEANRYDRETLQAYLQDIKSVNPVFTESSTKMVSELYLHMRREGANGFVVTTRNLLGIMRLSRALARLRYSETIDDVDVKEASRLLELSRASLTDRKDAPRKGPLQLSDVYSLMRDFYGTLRRGMTVNVQECRDALRRQGVTQQMLKDTIDMYSSLKVWTKEGEAYDVLHILSDA